MSVYKYPSSDEQIRSESNTHIEVTHFEKENELLLYIKGAEFPKRSYVDPEDVFSQDPVRFKRGTEILANTNKLKAIIIESLKIASHPVFILPTVYTLLFNLENLIDRFNRIGYKLVSPDILKDWHKTTFTKELELLIFSFLVELKIPEHKAEQFSELIGHIIQSDDAYQYRIQDLITSVGSLEPKYIKEYIRLSVERDDHVVSKKFKLLGNLARIALFVPKLRNAWGKAIKTIDISSLMFDDADRYWASFKTGYKFQGMTMEEQQAKYKEMGWKYPNLQIDEN